VLEVSLLNLVALSAY